MKRGRQLVLIGFLVLGACTAAHAASYYVDSAGGSDANGGTSPAAPWKSLGKVNSTTFKAGDTINFKRGGTWDGGLVLRSSGTSASPITVTAYGTGARPTIRNSRGGQYGSAIDIYGSYVVVERLLVRDAGTHGVWSRPGAHHNTIRDIEATAVGIGVGVDGPNNLIIDCYAHDLHMVVNTVGGYEDYGAVGYWLYSGASNTEVAYNKCINCRAPSHDFGYDGGALEIFVTAGKTLTNVNVHHNWAENTVGFVETGGGGMIRNVTMAYNVLYNTGSAVCLNSDTAVATFTFDHNTFATVAGDGYRVFHCRPDLSALTVRNNIFYSNVQIANTGRFTHSHNLYHVVNQVNGSGVGYPLSTGERTGPPGFVNVGAVNLHLQPGSPAIDAGLSLGYTRDVEGKAVPAGAAPDMGAYEYGGAAPALLPPQDLRVLHQGDHGDTVAPTP
jgi:hypothetical protein